MKIICFTMLLYLCRQIISVLYKGTSELLCGGDKWEMLFLSWVTFSEVLNLDKK